MSAACRREGVVGGRSGREGGSGGKEWEGGVEGGVGGKMRKEYSRKTSDSSQTVSGSMSASHDHLFSHDNSSLLI